MEIEIVLKTPAGRNWKYTIDNSDTVSALIWALERFELEHSDEVNNVALVKVHNKP